MTRASVVLLATIVVGASLVVAQTPFEVQKPGPTRERLNYFTGTWNLEVHMKASPFGSRAFFGTEHNEWMAGGSLLVSRQEGDAATAAGGLAVMAYRAQGKTYTYHVIKSTGETEDLSGTVEGHTWTWTSDGTASGNKVGKTRLIITELSSASYTLKFETASDGDQWTTIVEGKATRVMAHARQDVAFLR